MKKIIISSNTAWTIFNHRAGLIKTFQDAGYEVHTVAPVSNFTDIKNPGTIFHEVKNLERKGKNPFSDFFLILEYFRIYKSIKPEAVFTYTIKTNIYSAIACRLAKIPVVCTVNGLGTAFDNPESRTFKIVRLLYKIAFKKVKAVFFQNPDDRQFFLEQKIISGENIHLVPGSGVNLEKYSYSAIPENKIVFMLISRMLLTKGIQEFVEAGKKLKKEFPQTEFCLLGPSDADNPMGVKQQNLDSYDGSQGVKYLGAAKDVRPFIMDSAAVVLPSYYREGVPKILLEALAMGRPLITTDTSGCRETVQDGENGYFVKAKSVSDLYIVLKKFIQLSYEQKIKMGRKSRIWAENKFDEKKVIAEYMNVLKEID